MFMNTQMVLEAVRKAVEVAGRGQREVDRAGRRSHNRLQVALKSRSA